MFIKQTENLIILARASCPTFGHAKVRAFISDVVFKPDCGVVPFATEQHYRSWIFLEYPLPSWCKDDCPGWPPGWGPGSPWQISSTRGIRSLLSERTDRLLQRVAWNSWGSFHFMRSGVHGARLAVLGAVGGWHSLFLRVPACVWMTPQNCTWATSGHTPLSSSHPCLLFHQLQSTRLSLGSEAPFWAACHTLGLGTLGWLLCCLCRLDTSARAWHCRQGYLWLLWTWHLCFTEVWRAPRGHWRHWRSSSEGFIYFCFNPRPLLPLQCLVNRTF